MKTKIAVGGLLVALLASSLAPAQEGKAQTKVVTASVLPACPADTTFVVRVPSLSGLIQKFEASPIYKLKDRPEFSGVVSELTKKIDELRNQFRAELDVDLFDLLKTFRGETVFCVGNAATLVRVSKQLSEGTTDAEGAPTASFEDLPILFVADSQGSSEQLKSYLQKLKDYAQKNGAAVESADFHGGVITTVSDPDAGKEGAKSDGPERLHFGEHGTRFYFSTSRKLLEQTIVNVSSGSKEGLTSRPVYQATVKATDGNNSDIYFYVDFKQLTDAVGAALGPGLPAMIWGNVKGLLFGNSLNSAGVGAFLQKDGIRQTVFVHNEGASDGVLGWFKGASFTSAPSKLIPAGVETFSTIGFNAENFGKFVRGVMQIAMSMQGGAGADVDETVEQVLGMKLDDLLRAFGSRIHTFGTSKQVADNPLGDQTIVMELNNDEPVKRLLETANLMTNGALEPRKYLDRDVFSVTALGEGGPAFCVTDRLLIVSFVGESLEKLIRRLGKDAESIQDAEGFKKLAGGLPPKVDLLGYSDENYLANSLATVAETMREEAGGGLGFELGGAEEEIFLFLAALGKTFGPSIAYGAWQDAGLYYDSTVYYRGD